ncbi:MAG: ParA family protein [Alphaproteobacteria bacterium GM202ARS2]|nr:ParA family protein [Alphaproteobacteria bacterium GM202ARS2]
MVSFVVVRMIFFVANLKGGSGKSSIAVSLSVALCRLPTSLRVLLVDLNAEQGSSFDWLGGRMEHQPKRLLICERYSHQRDWVPDQVTQLTCIRFHGQRGIAELAPNFDHVVIDVLPQLSHLVFDMAALADLTVLPTSPSIMDARPTVEIAKSFKKCGFDYRLLLNRVSTAGRTPTAEFEFAQNYLATFERNTLEGWIPMRPAYARALARGKALQECSYGDLSIYAGMVMREIIEAASPWAIKGAPRKTRAAGK